MNCNSIGRELPLTGKVLSVAANAYFVSKEMTTFRLKTHLEDTLAVSETKIENS